MRMTALILASFLAAACARTSDAGSPREAANPDLAASMVVEVQSGTVELALHVTNHGREPVDFTFPSSQRYDFRITDAAGESVWQWSAARSFLQVVTEATLAPGETWTFRAEWSEPRPGRYVGTGWVTAQEWRLEQQSTFDVP